MGLPGEDGRIRSFPVWEALAVDLLVNVVLIDDEISRYKCVI